MKRSIHQIAKAKKLKKAHFFRNHIVFASNFHLGVNLGQVGTVFEVQFSAKRKYSQAQS